MEERLILVDGDDRAVGVGEKMRVHRDGVLHRAFSIFVFDQAGRLMLQQRATGKYHSGGLWSNTCCGHPRDGEATEAAAHRRLGEEMGFDCELRSVARIVYRIEVSQGLIEHEYDHIFVGRYDGRPRPNPLEVRDWAWRSAADLDAALRDRPQDFSGWLRYFLERGGPEELERWREAAGEGLAPR